MSTIYYRRGVSAPVLPRRVHASYGSSELPVRGEEALSGPARPPRTSASLRSVRRPRGQLPLRPRSVLTALLSRAEQSGQGHGLPAPCGNGQPRSPRRNRWAKQGVRERGLRSGTGRSSEGRERGWCGTARGCRVTRPGRGRVSEGPGAVVRRQCRAGWRNVEHGSRDLADIWHRPGAAGGGRKPIKSR